MNGQRKSVKSSTSDEERSKASTESSRGERGGESSRTITPSLRLSRAALCVTPFVLMLLLFA